MTTNAIEIRARQLAADCDDQWAALTAEQRRSYRRRARAEAPRPGSWAEVEAGDIVTVAKPYRRQPYRVEVTEVEQRTDRQTGYRFVWGRQLRLDGTRSTRRRRSSTQFLLDLADIIDVTKPS
jgi:hypothetical protein